MTQRKRDDLEAELSAYLDGELSGPRRRKVQRLLAESQEARRLLQELRQISDQLAALPRVRAPSELMPALSRHAQRHFLLDQPQVRTKRVLKLFGQVSAAAAALAACVLVGWQVLGRAAPPGVYASAPRGEQVIAREQVGLREEGSAAAPAGGLKFAAPGSPGPEGGSVEPPGRLIDQRPAVVTRGGGEAVASAAAGAQAPEGAGVSGAGEMRQAQVGRHFEWAQLGGEHRVSVAMADLGKPRVNIWVHAHNEEEYAAAARVLAAWAQQAETPAAAAGDGPVAAADQSAERGRSGAQPLAAPSDADGMPLAAGAPADHPERAMPDLAREQASGASPLAAASHPHRLAVSGWQRQSPGAEFAAVNERQPAAEPEHQGGARGAAVVDAVYSLPATELAARIGSLAANLATPQQVHVQITFHAGDAEVLAQAAQIAARADLAAAGVGGQPSAEATPMWQQEERPLSTKAVAAPARAAEEQTSREPGEQSPSAGPPAPRFGIASAGAKQSPGASEEPKRRLSTSDGRLGMQPQGQFAGADMGHGKQGGIPRGVSPPAGGQASRAGAGRRVGVGPREDREAIAEEIRRRHLEATAEPLNVVLPQESPLPVESEPSPTASMPASGGSTLPGGLIKLLLELMFPSGRPQKACVPAGRAEASLPPAAREITVRVTLLPPGCDVEPSVLPVQQEPEAASPPSH